MPMSIFHLICQKVAKPELVDTSDEKFIAIYTFGYGDIGFFKKNKVSVTTKSSYAGPNLSQGYIGQKLSFVFSMRKLNKWLLCKVGFAEIIKRDN